jgi:hypothetical protein
LDFILRLTPEFFSRETGNPKRNFFKCANSRVAGENWGALVAQLVLAVCSSARVIFKKILVLRAIRRRTP